MLLIAIFSWRYVIETMESLNVAESVLLYCITVNTKHDVKIFQTNFRTHDVGTHFLLCKEDSFLNSAEVQKKAVAQFPAVMILSFIHTVTH